jgi:hypothetical protein
MNPLLSTPQSEGEILAKVIGRLGLVVNLEQLRRSRGTGQADEQPMERNMVLHAFHLRGPARSEMIEGIRTLAVDHPPRRQPDTVAEVDPAEVQAFFCSPWAAAEHPVRAMA